MTGTNIALDTNAYSDWQRGIRWGQAVSQSQIVWMPFVVIAELKSGFEAGKKSRKNGQILDAFLSSQSVRLLFADEITLTIHAKIFAELRRQGTPIPVNDIWIAALCIQHNLPLATADGHFRNVSILVLVEG